MKLGKARHARKKLQDEVVKLSVADSFDKARSEWVVTNLLHQEIDDTVHCICGSKGIKDVYTVENKVNGAVIATIGSSCVDFFGTEEVKSSKAILNRRVSARKSYLENGVNDLEAYLNGLSKSTFSEKFFLYLYERGVLKPTKSNQFAPINDVYFLWSSVQLGVSKLNSEERQRFHQLWVEVVIPWILGNPSSELYVERVEHDMSSALSEGEASVLEARVSQVKEELQVEFEAKFQEVQRTCDDMVHRANQRASSYREEHVEAQASIVALLKRQDEDEKKIIRLTREVANQKEEISRQKETISKHRSRITELNSKVAGYGDGASNSELVKTLLAEKDELIADLQSRVSDFPYNNNFKLPELEFLYRTERGHYIKKHWVDFYKVRDEVRSGDKVNYKRLSVAVVANLLYHGILSIDEFNTFLYYKATPILEDDFFTSDRWLNLSQRLYNYFENTGRWRY